jgi:predicted O-linked N-acetylglucosamine transferase (SPINDLY family)
MFLDADRAHVARRYADAVVLYQLALTQHPTSFDAWNGLGAASASLLEYGDAIAAFRRALALRPHDARLQVNLGRALFALGHVSEAVGLYRLAAASPDAQARAMAIQTLACIAPGDPALDNQAVLALRQAWAADEAASGAAPGAAAITPLRVTPAPDARLRIAYYGSYFASRNWMKMYMGVLNAHDRHRFEITLIADGAVPSVAAGYGDHPDDRVWDVTGVSNADLAGHIAAAGIDVLVDLNGYSHQSRMPLLLHRAAPVQMAWNGMYGTTGFPGVDVLVADAVVVPPDEERFCTERVHRVAHTYLPFHMFYDTPDVAAPPSLANGFITFGSLNSAYKLTNETLDAWARILHALPTARLLLRNAALDHVSARADLLARLAARNIEAARVTLLGRAEHTAFLQTYDHIDIALDVFPYNGGTTTAEALWQGVPVLTIYGDRWAGRTSASILTAAGLGEWVAPDLPALVALAARTAQSKLEDPRATQRARLSASPACDGVALCRQLESLYLSEAARHRAGTSEP